MTVKPPDRLSRNGSGDPVRGEQRAYADEPPQMPTRLHSKYRALAERILSAGHETLSRVVGVAARLAVENAGVEDAAGSAIAALNEKAPFDAEARQRLVDQQAYWEGQYLDAQDAMEDSSTLIPRQAALPAFRRARALAALLEASGRLDGTRVTEVVYEALAASPDEGAAVKMISAVM